MVIYYITVSATFIVSISGGIVRGNTQVYTHTYSAPTQGVAELYGTTESCLPLLMISWCRLGADCFMCWMNDAQPL